MPRKQWVAGDVLTAVDLMNYLMDQAVDVCTSSTRPASPEEGMVIYETNTDLLRVWDAAEWLTVPYLETANTFTQRQTFQAGIDVAGSPSGYHGEVRFSTATSGAGVALSSVAVGAPLMYFDHRGASNTGSWLWRNGSGAANQRMSLSGAGDLGVAGDVTVGGDLTLTGGSVDVVGLVNADATGANNAVFVDNDNHYWEVDGSGGWRFANRWAISGALFTFVGGASTTELARITDPGAVDNTALWLSWKSHDGTLRFKQVRSTQAGDIDGTTRRYLYVVES